ncbi:hypothetical protein ACN47E_009370 [Coniothyrium glycines]
MALLGSSFQHVQTWAQLHFAADYKHLPHHSRMIMELHAVPDHNEAGFIKGLVIGSTTNKAQRRVRILAWLQGDRMHLGYIGKTRMGKVEVRFKTIGDNDAIFDTPFKFITGAQLNTALPRLEALVRYYFLAKGPRESPYVSGAFWEFSTHFAGACQDVAAGYEALSEQYRETLHQLEATWKGQAENHAPNTEGGSLGHQLFPISTCRTGDVTVLGGPSLASPPVGIMGSVNDKAATDQEHCDLSLQEDTKALDCDTRIIVLPSPSPSPPPAHRQRATEFPFPTYTAKLGFYDSRNEQELQTKTQNEIEVGHGHFKLIQELQRVHDTDKKRWQKDRFDQHVRLMVAEGMTRAAEQDADGWRRKYEEKRQLLEALSKMMTNSM